LAESLARHGETFEDVDFRGEAIPFADLHASRLAKLAELVDEMLEVCPGCGRVHGEHADDATVQPGAYVHAETGDSVRVSRVEERKVYAWAQVSASGRQVQRVYDRDYFEGHFVPADDVEVLGGPAG
jgi:hypothetical protein